LLKRKGRESWKVFGLFSIKTKMSASEQMRAMLDQLMGTSINGPDTNPHGVKYTDHKVCKSFLYGCCPHEILASTRMDLGECPKIHDLALRADYQQAASARDCFYDVEATEHLRAFIEDCDRRTELAKKRLAETQEELSAEVSSKAEKVHELSETIGKKLAQAEQAGAEGKVEESMKFMEEVDDIRKKKVSAELEYRNSMPASSYQQQKLRVCEICSAYLGIHDNDRRLADHFGGKLHLGFIKIREKLDGLLATYEDRKTKRREARIRDGLPPTANAADFSYVGEGRGGLGDVAREKEDEERKSSSRRDRDRSRDRSRDLDRDRERDRAGDRDRDRGDRDRDRDRDRHRRRRSRSRSRDRHGHRRRHKHRSRSRDRRRSRSRDKSERSSRRSRSRSREDRRSKSQRSPDQPTQDFSPNHESHGNGAETKITETETSAASGDAGFGGAHDD